VTKPLIAIGCADSQLSILLLSSFAKEGYYASLRSTAKEVMEFMSSGTSPGVLLLDDSLTLSSVGVLTYSALRLPTPPLVLVLSESVREEDEVGLLNLGAADYIPKPLRFRVLLARIDKAQRTRVVRVPSSS
jgi:DNA-binding response OmpR family regulator